MGIEQLADSIEQRAKNEPANVICESKRQAERVARVLRRRGHRARVRQAWDSQEWKPGPFYVEARALMSKP